MRAHQILYAAALLLGLLPLWVVPHLPMVDLPQHLHLISALHRLHDPETLYPAWFSLRPALTPYLGYYYAVSALNWLVPLETANRLFLSAYVAGWVLSLGFLLRSLGRPRWPSLLALPLAYGDSFGWGFVNSFAAFPWAFLCCAFFVRALQDAPRRRRWVAALCLTLISVLLFHVLAFVFLALALPWLLLTTPVPQDAARARAWTLAGVVPAVLLFGLWVRTRVNAPVEIAKGQPWKAWGPPLSSENLVFQSVEANARAFPLLLANLFRDGSDRWALWGVGAVALVALGLGLAFPAGAPSTLRERLRLPGLAAGALALYFLLPFDVHGYSYYVNPRFAHPAAALLVVSVPASALRFRRLLLVASTLCALLLAITLSRGFLAFAQESAEWEALLTATGARPKVMGLIFNPSSAVVRHPVFNHSAAVLAQARGGLSNFSFATTPHSPLRYAQAAPPTFPSEWQPRTFDEAQHAAFYEYFLVRGVTPSRVFSPAFFQQLTVVQQSGQSWLLRRH